MQRYKRPITCLLTGCQHYENNLGYMQRYKRPLPASLQAVNTMRIT